ncbi:exodeoxyribonuclease III [Simiduia curdlanivorans]|uniref:Exodeoxyribonuclease III n=1 Tax=Simiduia curdlanivorans TaxID=1492769 RepID=A0ABV8V1W1_9GAMM|nr:exodeoxyribonuclease III [Simiduia curdlanivorans]MDN3639939.1 exodeoxyribonuclease III [Simiduia curdlanivorans]
MNIISFNINSIRARLPQLEAIVKKYAPDFIGLQETKVQDIDFPISAIEAMGYHAIYHGQKTHYGVALLSKQKPTEIVKGFESDAVDAQRRFVGGKFIIGNQDIWVYNGYFPQGENEKHVTKYPAKRKFYADLLHLLKSKHHPSESIVIMGDINISPQDIDIGIGEQNRKRWLKDGKCSFLPEERQWLQALQAWGLVDSFRHHHPEQASEYSWFDYRSRGFEDEPRRGLRIDSILCTKSLVESSIGAGIDYEIRGMEKPSDHAPIFTRW